MDSTINTGTPPMLLLPAFNYKFRISDEYEIINIPRKGKYSDIAPDLFDEDNGQFSIFDEETKTFYLPSITKVLFAVKKYPDLESDEFFMPYSIEIKDQESVDIVGKRVKILVSEDRNEV